MAHKVSYNRWENKVTCVALLIWKINSVVNLKVMHYFTTYLGGRGVVCTWKKILSICCRVNVPIVCACVNVL